MTRDDIFFAAFNQGYIIATENPQLLKEVQASMESKTDYALGFNYGVKAAKGRSKGQGISP